MARAPSMDAATDLARSDLESLLDAERRAAERVEAARAEAAAIVGEAEEEARRLDAGAGDEEAIAAGLRSRLRSMETDDARRRDAERAAVAAEVRRLEGLLETTDGLVEWLVARVGELNAAAPDAAGEAP